MHVGEEATFSLCLFQEGTENFPEISCLSLKTGQVIPHPTHLTAGCKFQGTMGCGQSFGSHRAWGASHLRLCAAALVLHQKPVVLGTQWVQTSPPPTLSLTITLPKSFFGRDGGIHSNIYFTKIVSTKTRNQLIFLFLQRIRCSLQKAQKI